MGNGIKVGPNTAQKPHMHDEWAKSPKAMGKRSPTVCHGKCTLPDNVKET
jgi:hypothetical protein